MCSVEQLLNLQVQMDSDTDQDEDEVHQSFSITVSERESPSCIYRRTGSESNLQSTEIRNNSGNIEETKLEERNLLFMRDSASGDSLTDLSPLKNEEPPLKVTKVSFHSQKRRISYKSIVDDRPSCPEKSVEETCDPINDPVNDGKNNQEDTPEQLPGSQNQVPEVEAQGEASHTTETSTSASASDSPATEIDGKSENTDHSNRDETSRESTTKQSITKDSIPHVNSHIDAKLSQSGNSRDIQKATIPVTTDHLIENQITNIQSTTTISAEKVLSKHSAVTTGLSEAVMDVDIAQETSSIGQLAGKKRKYSALWKTADAEGAVGGSSAENSVSSGDAEEGFENKDSDKEAKKKKNRCAVCRKKVGLTGFECRCGGLFCAVHRYSDKHDCTFDYREMGAQEIRRNNPVVVGEKIQKI